MEVIGRTQPVHVEFHAGILHSRMRHGKCLNLAVMRRRDRFRSAVEQFLQNRLRECRAFDRVCSRSEFIQKDQRPLVRVPQDLDGVFHVGRKCGERLFDRLFVTVIRVYFFKQGNL